MVNPESLEEQYLDSILNNPSSSGQLDVLRAEFPADEIIHGGLKGGAIEAFQLGRMTRRSGSSEFNPGIHRGIDIKSINTSDGNEQIIARNPRLLSVPLVSHVVLDIPERTEAFSGNYSYAKVANFVLALTRHVSDVSGNRMSVYVNNGRDSGLIFDDQSNDAYLAELNLEDKSGFIEETDTSLNGLMKIVSERVRSEYDGVFVVSDLQDGYNHKTGEFDWENQLSSVALEMGDRLWFTKIGSPSHKTLDFSAVEGLGFGAVDAMNREYASSATKKAERVGRFFQENPTIRCQNVELLRDENSSHPVDLMIGHILGKEIN